MKLYEIKNKILFPKHSLKDSDIHILRKIMRNQIVDKEINYLREVLNHIREIELSISDIEFLSIGIMKKKIN